MEKDLTRWLAGGKFGIMVHYLITPPGETPEQRTAEFNRTVDAFELAGFMRQFDAMGPDWLIFTIGQNTGYYCGPNAFLDAALPGHTSRRNLPLEIAREVKARGKRFIAYLPAEVCGQKPEIHRAFGWVGDDPRRGVEPTQRLFQPNYQRFIRDYAIAMGRLLDGWWFDGCYAGDWKVFPNWNLDFAGYIRAARAGNPEAICAFNDGAFCAGIVAPLTELEHYHPGEVHVLVNGDIGLGWWARDPKPYMPTTRFIDGVQWHGLLPVDSTFCGPDLPDQHYSDDVLISLITRINAVQGAITLNLPIGDHGLVPTKTVEQIVRVSTAVNDGENPDRKTSYDVSRQKSVEP